MCSVKGGVQLLKDAAGLVVSPVTFLISSRSILLDEDSDSSSSEEDGEQKQPHQRRHPLPLAKTTVPQTLNFDAPADAAPGKPVCLAGPHGPIMLPLPEDVQPGKPCSIRLGPPEHYSISV